LSFLISLICIVVLGASPNAHGTGIQTFLSNLDGIEAETRAVFPSEKIVIGYRSLSSEPNQLLIVFIGQRLSQNHLFHSLSTLNLTQRGSAESNRWIIWEYHMGFKSQIQLFIGIVKAWRIRSIQYFHLECGLQIFSWGSPGVLQQKIDQYRLSDLNMLVLLPNISTLFGPFASHQVVHSR
jgi:hypothetical protein